MAFKLGYRRLPGIANGGNIKNKFKFKVEHKDLKDGIVAEAVSKDKIRIDKDVDKDSKLYKEALAHEAVHCKEMSEGRIAYGDEIFPWEQRAMKAENYV
jgi:hypothetical protein